MIKVIIFMSVAVLLFIFIMIISKKIRKGENALHEGKKRLVNSIIGFSGCLLM